MEEAEVVEETAVVDAVPEAAEDVEAEAVEAEDVVMILAVVVLVVVGDVVDPTCAPSHLVPMPPHFCGKKLRTSSVRVSRSFSAKILLPSTVGCV